MAAATSIRALSLSVPAARTEAARRVLEPFVIHEGPFAAVERSGGERSGGERSGGEGAVLDGDAWLARRVDAMRRALAARWEQQADFRAVLRSTRGLELLHFERAGARSFWGGSLGRDDGLAQGDNQLGRMLMSLRDEA